MILPASFVWRISVVAVPHQDAVGNARDRYESPSVVADLHGVHGGGTSQVHGRGRGRDGSLAPGANVGGVELRTHRVGLLTRVGLARVNLRCEGGGCLGEGGRGASVQDARGLSIAVDGHRDDGALRAVFEDLHPRGLHEGAGPVRAHPSASGEGVGARRVGVFRLVIVCHGI